MKNKNDLKKRLNLNYLDLTNKTICVGQYDLPQIHCNPTEYPDYIALYSQPCDYHKTANTCVGFYDYDFRFDNKNGLYAAIRQNDRKLLNLYKKRFEGIKFFISPDYSECGDVPFYHNIHRLGRAREVSIWITLNIGSTVIPNMPCCCEKDLDYFCDGLEDVSAIAFSTKGRTDTKRNIELLKKSVEVSVEKLDKLKAIIVYDTSTTNSQINELFEPALKKNIKIIVPDNMLKHRNTILRSKNVQHK